MEIQKTTGIVLSSRAYGEGDILSIILTREYGKRKFIFKGLKKSRRRPQSGAESGAFVSLIYYYHEGRDASIVNDFQVKKHYRDIRNNLEKIYHLAFMLESVEKTIGFNDDSSPLFDLLAAGIETLSRTERPVHFTAFFLVHLLRLNGLLSDISHCKICGSTPDRYILDAADLNPVCSNCASSRDNTGFSGAPAGNVHLDRGVTDFLVQSQRQKFSAMELDRYNSRGILDLIFFIALFLEGYFHCTLKSKEFILSERFLVQ